jgi:hypothetical protein
MRAAITLGMPSRRQENEQLKQAFELKNTECKRIKKLARTILEQRSDIEVFLFEAVSQVRQQIASARQDYIKVSQSQ